jgi:MerR family transcriptional regulator, light-induced transcriptional regulator
VKERVAMDEVHYLISDASKKVDVEAHVLRYWEEELELDIPRNEMGHRYYTDLHIRLFKQVKNLKEKGFQLKAIKHALNQVLKKDGKAQTELSDEILERDMNAALNEFKEEDGNTSLSTMKSDGVSVVAMEEKMEQFQQIMNLIIGRALEVNNEKLSQDISCLVNEKMGKELEFLLQASDEKEEERFRQLDETLRAYQKGGQAEAAAAKVPFFKRRKFGRSGKKLRDGK